MKTLLFLLLALPALAKEGPTKRSCRLLFFNPPPGAPKEIYLYDGVETRKVELPSMNLSDVYPISGEAPAVRMLIAPVENPEEIPAGAPTALLSETVRDFFIVVSVDPTNKILPLRMQIIDAGGPSFGKGRMMWFNLTEDAVAGTLGKRALQLKPNSRVIIEPPAVGAEAFPVELFYQVPGGKPQPISRTQWMHDPRSRMLMFVHGGENGVAPQVSGFKDFRIEEKKKE